MEKAKILIIDDEKDFLELMEKWLQQQGYIVVTAADGADGVEKAKKEDPDMVICDIRMPKKSGYEVLAEIRKGMKRHIPVIIVSVIDDFNNIEEAYDGEADFYLSKPVELAVLARNIHTLLNIWKRKSE